MMRRVLAVATAVLSVLVLTDAASAQTVDELIARNLEAKGGLAQIRAITSIRQSSEFTTQGMVGKMTLYSKRPNLMRQEIVMGAETMVNGFDGETPWVINRMATGSDEPLPIEGPQADMMRNQASFDGPLVDYKDRGLTVELVGSEQFDGRLVHHVKITPPEGQIQHVYLDGATGLEARIVSEGPSGRVEQVFSDYREVNGMTMPFLVTIYAGGAVMAEMRVVDVEFNPDLNDALFRMIRDR